MADFPFASLTLISPLVGTEKVVLGETKEYLTPDQIIALTKADTAVLRAVTVAERVTTYQAIAATGTDTLSLDSGWNVNYTLTAGAHTLTFDEGGDTTFIGATGTIRCINTNGETLTFASTITGATTVNKIVDQATGEIGAATAITLPAGASTEALITYEVRDNMIIISL